MALMGLTRQQANILRFICDYVDQNGGVSPSYRDISKHVGVVLSSVSRHLDSLVERGYIRRQGNRVRTLVVLHRPPTSHSIDGIEENLVEPVSLNMQRYHDFEAALRLNFSHASSGDDPDPHEAKALQWLAISLISLPDDAAIARRLRQLSAALANFAMALDRKPRS